MGRRPDVRTAPPRPQHAVRALVDLVRDADPPLTLVPLGPQSNVADLVTTHPEVVPRLAAVHFMGGSGAGGNVTAAAEFNVHHDPEAAAAVVACGATLRMYGLDVFEQVRLPRPGIDRLLTARQPALRLAGGLCAASAARSGTDDACLGDAGAVAALVRPDLLRAVERPVAVETGHGPARGETVVDRRHGRRRDVATGARPVQVYEQVDGPALAEHWLATMFTWYG